MSNAETVEALLQSGTYDLQAFLAYLKSFIVSGTVPNSTLLVKILLQAVANFSTGDYIACMSLVPAQLQDNSDVETEIFALNDLDNLLSSGEFGHFWEMWSNEHKSKFESRGCNVAQFEGLVRRNVVLVMAITTISITTTEAAKYVHVGSPDEAVKTVKDVISQYGAEEKLSVESADAEKIVFGKNQFNNPESDAKQASISFTDILSIVV